MHFAGVFRFLHKIMPIEGLETADDDATTTAASGKTTDASTKPAAGTQPANDSEATPITETPEFTAALTAAIEKKIPQLKRQLARSITGEKDDKTTGADDANNLQKLQEMEARIRTFEAKDTVHGFLTDVRNKLNIPADAVSGITELVLARLEFDDAGKPSNLKEATDSVKASFPRLFANQPSSVNAADGRQTTSGPVNMNDWIRKAG